MKAATPIALLQGDCREQMKTLPDDSIDAIICDPPYNLAFMGKTWDTHINNAAYQEWTREWATEAFRVLKRGGHLLAFGGTRTYHRQTCGIEDAGFEIRDCLAWIYGTGFPKSLDVSKAIDKAAGAAREVVGHGVSGTTAIWSENGGMGHYAITASATTEAEQWEGWGTALKPAMEPIVVARKPFKGTVAANVLEHGTGALNIDASRVGTPWVKTSGQETKRVKRTLNLGHSHSNVSQPHDAGRWPANILFDEEAAAVLDEQSGVSTSTRAKRGAGTGAKADVYEFGGQNRENTLRGHVDKGGASRFFYVAKAGKKERNAGLDDFEEKRGGPETLNAVARDGAGEERMSERKNTHPCVKPIQLLRYLSKLVTPPGGTILDPFMGSGSGGCAAVLEGFNYIGIETEPEYLTIAKARIEHWQSSSE